ncbi:riboflavin synthase [Mangrovicoccus algicola]|uniref:Riboflavin synthase n=1 Tax=Mangrovicoccus algicola TaxID=2771008 RepID=A0A8J6YW39_9RHOB|nr:riboflavin synthase [Mangrovicoccus algicola]MBE3637133.1 riboflavin synthase [Mangrovicoccus algicola]
MFTGIITDIGQVVGLEQRGDLAVRIATAYDPAGIEIGASIACDGICLTVTGRGGDPGAGWFAADLSAETVSRTSLARRPWQQGSRINLERALRVGDELGGHIVSGHVDGIAEVVSLAEEGDSTRLRLRAMPELARFVASKGSVALNGTSLTVNEVEGCEFGVNIIPHTRAHTTWGGIRAGDAVNLEIDTLARYVARLQDWE